MVHFVEGVLNEGQQRSLTNTGKHLGWLQIAISFESAPSIFANVFVSRFDLWDEVQLGHFSSKGKDRNPLGIGKQYGSLWSRMPKSTHPEALSKQLSCTEWPEEKITKTFIIAHTWCILKIEHLCYPGCKPKCRTLGLKNKVTINWWGHKKYLLLHIHTLVSLMECCSKRSWSHTIRSWSMISDVDGCSMKNTPFMAMTTRSRRVHLQPDPLKNKGLYSENFLNTSNQQSTCFDWCALQPFCLLHKQICTQCIPLGSKSNV